MIVWEGGMCKGLDQQRTHVDRLRLGVLDEATRVDHDDIRIVRVVGDVKAAAVEVAKQHLACAGGQVVS